MPRRGAGSKLSVSRGIALALESRTDRARLAASFRLGVRACVSGGTPTLCSECHRRRGPLQARFARGPALKRKCFVAFETAWLTPRAPDSSRGLPPQLKPSKTFPSKTGALRSEEHTSELQSPVHL